MLYAFYAMAQELTSSGRFFWFYTPRFHGSIYGSYVNHDHYAGLMEMLVPFPLVIAMGRMLRGAQRVLVGFCAVLMATTIVLSGSRGGMIAFAFEVFAFTAVTIYQRRSPKIALATFALCSAVLGFLLFLGKGKVLGRLGDLGPDMRFKMTRDCLKMFTLRPVLGWGWYISHDLSQLSELLHEPVRQPGPQRLRPASGGNRITRLRSDAVVHLSPVPSWLPHLTPLGIQVGRRHFSRRPAGKHRTSSA